jgi:hypothetical protein
MDEPERCQLGAVRTTEEFARCMRDLRKQQDNPSLRDLEQWGISHERPLPKSSVQEVLAGTRLPNRTMLLNFLVACGFTSDLDVQPWLDALERVLAAQPAPRQRLTSRQELGRVPATRFFVEQDSLNEIQRLVAGAREEVWLWGTTLSMIIPYLVHFLKRCLAKDVRVKVLMIRPAGAAMAMSVLRAGPDGDSEEEQMERLNFNLSILNRLSERATGLEIRLIDYLAPYTLYGYDPGLESGRLDLRLGSFHGQHELRPTFRLERGFDGEWFDYFYNQFVSVWNDASPDHAAAAEPATALSDGLELERSTPERPAPNRPMA